jgi:hypothetical protein
MVQKAKLFAPSSKQMHVSLRVTRLLSFGVAPQSTRAPRADSAESKPNNKNLGAAEGENELHDVTLEREIVAFAWQFLRNQTGSKSMCT